MKPILSHPSYNDIEKGCALLSLQVTKSSVQPEVIVGLTRGGLLPAVIMSHMLDLPMNAASYSSHSGKGDNKNHINILPDIPPTHFESGTGRLPVQAHILLVDDIADSGRTLREVQAQYEERDHTVTTAVLYWKESAVVQPDFWWQEIPDDSPWIIFPYEI